MGFIGNINNLKKAMYENSCNKQNSSSQNTKKNDDAAYNNLSIYDFYKDKNNNTIASTASGVNGKIDDGFYQGTKGDCWLLSGVLSLSYTNDGKELIKNAISKDTNGNYQVYFRGLNKSYTVTEQELQSKNKSTSAKSSPYSTGDDDMLLMELAVEKIIKEGKADIETANGLTGGSAYYLYQLLTGNEVQYAYVDEPMQAASLLVDYYNNQNEYSATLGVAEGFAGLPDDHAYAIKSMDSDSVTLVNPWNSTKDVKISTESLFQNIGKYDVSTVDVQNYGYQQ